jgi:transposase
MQGKKIHQETLFIQFQLSDYVPADNFYRRLKHVLSLDYLYRSTAKHYGKDGQKSIDPVVFMKLMLVGYLENINSDRRIVTSAGMRMDILYFLGYNLGEELPWHSTLSRTRKLYGGKDFVDLFREVLKLCINEGLISGKRQAVDSALIPANAAKQAMVERLVMEDASVFSRELAANSEEKPQTPETPDEPEGGGPNEQERKETVNNRTHYSPSDPEARLTTKPGKPMRLYYRSQVSVDTASHFITYIKAFKGNQEDRVSMPAILKGIAGNMAECAIRVKEVLADAGYSSGESIRALIANGIEGYIPKPGNLKLTRAGEGFVYDADNDRYTCTAGIQLPFRRIEHAYDNPAILKKVYESNKDDCKNCPFRQGCVNAKGFKKLVDTMDKPLYEYMHRRAESANGKRMKLLRSSTVEPVFGSLINYTGLNRINVKGLSQANKCMLAAATAYNLKKLLKCKAKALKEAVVAAVLSVNTHTGKLLGELRQQYNLNSALLY